MNDNLAPGRQLPDLELPDHSGHRRTLSELAAGDPLIVSFYRGWWCPKEQAYFRRLVALQSEAEVAYTRFVSISIDPEHDTPDVLAEYARTFEARPGWTFATGRLDDINTIRRRLGLYDSEDITQHMGLLTFGNEPEGKWGATPALDTPKNILYYVLRRVDPFQYTVWPTVTPAAATGSGTER